ncbi:MAG: MaoC family dehydratase [Candidatus Lokiarchaeota archaeon]|nr:MaoC family dehydratase [Candidatus Harpocratesius repetitus]
MTQEIHIKSFDEFNVGDTAQITVKTSNETVEQFGKLTTDYNPLHFNDEFAAKTIFKKRLVHGAFSSGLISAVIGMKLPGPGALYLDQYCKFRKPVYIGDELTAIATVIEKKVKEREGKPPMKLLILETIVKNQNGIIVTEGKATILVQDV